MRLKSSATTHAIAFLTFFLMISPLTGQPTNQSAESKPVQQAPIQVNGKILFMVPGILSFPAEARAEAISKRLKDLSKDVMFKPESLSVADAENTTDIFVRDLGCQVRPSGRRQ